MTDMHPVFGDAEVHPITGRHIEKGKGSLPEHVQAQHHLAAIEKEQGKEVADRMRAEISPPQKAPVLTVVETETEFDIED